MNFLRNYEVACRIHAASKTAYTKEKGQQLAAVDLCSTDTSEVSVLFFSQGIIPCDLYVYNYPFTLPLNSHAFVMAVRDA